MFKDFFTLALQGTLRKKRSSILVFLVLMFSFSCAITTLSLTKSISDTNAEFRLNTYGEWYVAAVRSTPEDGEWLTSQSWTRETVHNRLYKNVYGYNVGIMDPAILDMARTEMVAGRLPEKKGEIALSVKALDESEIEDYRIGQMISIIVGYRVVAEEETENEEYRSRKLSGTLCGVFEDFDDLWTVNYTPNIKVAVTEETITEHYNEMVAEITDCSLDAPKVYEQYYIEVNRSDRIQAANDVRAHEFTPMENGTPQFVNINYAAYPRGQETVADEEMYSYLVAVVVFIAIICIYILQLPEQVHSFAVLRSIGITKGQLLLLTFIESMLLAIPAIILGLPFGIILTRTALSLFMYSGSVEVQVAIPYTMLVKLFVMWLAIILLSRLVIFLITIRTPLTGRMQMQTSTARKAKGLRTALIALMLVIFGSSVVFIATEGARSFYWLDWHEVIPDYRIHGYYESPLTPEKAELIASIPGVRRVEVFRQGNDMDGERLLISYDGIEQRNAPYYYVLDENHWDESFDFGEDKEAFHNGDVVFLCFGGDTNMYEFMYGEPAEEIPPASGEKITLRACSREGFIVAEDRVDVVVKQLSANTRNRSSGIFCPYTVVMSEAYFKKLVSKLPEGAEWGDNLGGGEYGYPGVIATADSNAGDLSADIGLETFCKNNFMSLDNKREELLAKRQSFKQELIKLFACGGCVALVALLLFGGALSLEAESEKRSYSILRAIGMSRRQVRRKVLGKSLARSILAVACGWVLTFSFGVWKELKSQSEPDFAEAFSSYFSSLKYYKFDLSHALPVSVVCIIILLTVSVLMKRRLWKKQFSIKE